MIEGPDPEPYLSLTDPDPDPRGQETNGADPDPQHCLSDRFVVHHCLISIVIAMPGALLVRLIK